MPSVAPAIAAGSQDGTLYDGLLETTGTQLSIDNLATPSQQIWLRFPGVAIPQGATITSAVITLIGSASSNSITANFVANDADDASALSVGEDGTARTWTSAAANTWAIPALSDGSSYDSPDISDIVQTVVNRSGWSSGNNLLIRMAKSADGGKNSWRRFRSYDNGSTPKAAVLTVSYTTAAGSRQTQCVIIG